jgi:hypothetical protein
MTNDHGQSLPVHNKMNIVWYLLLEFDCPVIFRNSWSINRKLWINWWNFSKQWSIKLYNNYHQLSIDYDILQFFPMVFRWLFRGFPIVFPWLSQVFSHQKLNQSSHISPYDSIWLVVSIPVNNMSSSVGIMTFPIYGKS